MLGLCNKSNNEGSKGLQARRRQKNGLDEFMTTQNRGKVGKDYHAEPCFLRRHPKKVPFWGQKWDEFLHRLIAQSRVTFPTKRIEKSHNRKIVPITCLIICKLYKMDLS